MVLFHFYLQTRYVLHCREWIIMLHKMSIVSIWLHWCLCIMFSVSTNCILINIATAGEGAGAPWQHRSGRLWLESAGQTLLPGQTDSFSLISSRLVTPVETLTIGHDNSGPSPGWFLEKVCWSYTEAHVCTVGRAYGYLNSPRSRVPIKPVPHGSWNASSPDLTWIQELEVEEWT